jgi:hypothetical protein
MKLIDKVKTFTKVATANALLFITDVMAFAGAVSSTGTGGGGGDIGQVIGEHAKEVGSSAKEVKTAIQNWLDVGMIIAFFVFAILPAYGGYYWYTHSKGNPQQGANTTVALAYAIAGAILGIVLWSLLYAYMKSKGILGG